MYNTRTYKDRQRFKIIGIILLLLREERIVLVRHNIVTYEEGRGDWAG